MSTNLTSTAILDKNRLLYWGSTLLLLTVGLLFATVLMSPQRSIGAIPFPHAIEFIIAYWILSLFCLTYGVVRMLSGKALSGPLHPLIVVMIFIIALVLALFIVTRSAQETYILRILMLLLLPLLALLPVLLYLSFLSLKRKPLLDELELNLKRIYAKTDLSASNIINMYKQKFENLFGTEQVSPTFQALLPIILTTMFMSLGWLYIASKITYLIDSKNPQTINLDPVNYGFIGVYLFSLNFLFRRYVQSDLGPVAYSNINLRLITTFIWTMLIWKLADVAYVHLLAFAVGIFPDVGWQWLVKQLQALTKFVVSDQSKNYSLSQISGITIWVENRLLEEDIENIHNLVTANLPELLLQTNYAPGRLLDWIDQAILQIHLLRCKKRPEDTITAVIDDLGLNGITTASGFMTYYANEKCHPKDDSGQLARLASAIQNETNLYHIKVWHSAYQSSLTAAANL